VVNGVASGRLLLVMHRRTSREKARAVAAAEALQLLVGLDPQLVPGGPSSERRGTFWLTVPASRLPECQDRLPLLGYTEAVELMAPSQPGAEGEPVRWRGVPYRLQTLHRTDPEAWRERAPDRRLFLLPNPEGGVRVVRGYRGGGGALARRGLPVEDAAVLVNLVRNPNLGWLLDPFAGAGGIAVEAVRSGWRTLTLDVDPVLRHGLAALAGTHLVADAARLPLGEGSVDAIATEPPYEELASAALAGGLLEFGRVLRPGGRLALLCAAWQADLARGLLGQASLRVVLDEPVDRKGLDVRVLVCVKR
jgi:SAM-dependent methyltransferase